MNRDLPSISNSAYGNATSLADMLSNGNAHQMLGQVTALESQLFKQSQQAPAKLKPKEEPMAARRLVQVFIADPNENVPLEMSVLYRGEQKLTDATDQELFFECDIKAILDKHNAERVKLVDKKVKERTEYLEPAKIRELKMVVVTIASF